METELASLKSRLTIFQSEAENKEQNIEVLEQMVKTLKKAKSSDPEVNDDGWDVEDDELTLGSDDEQDIGVLKLKYSEINMAEEAMRENVNECKEELKTVLEQVKELSLEKKQLKVNRDEAVREFGETRNKLEVLTEFFNKKEAELQKQIGFQTARFGDISGGKISTAEKLESVNGELEESENQLKLLRAELDKQEKTLKDVVDGHEKKAHENWVAARHAERKVNEIQVINEKSELVDLIAIVG